VPTFFIDLPQVPKCRPERLSLAQPKLVKLRIDYDKSPAPSEQAQRLDSGFNLRLDNDYEMAADCTRAAEPKGSTMDAPDLLFQHSTR
jgi:hypothetical protein